MKVISIVDRLEFSKAMGIMVKCLPATKVEDRIDGLYHFFGDQNLELIKATAEFCSKTMERWPTPGNFSFALRKVRSDLPELARILQPEEECSMCNSSGRVSVKRVSDGMFFCFRCHCANAARYDNIPAWTQDKNSHYKPIESNAYQDLFQNPELYEKGLDKLVELGITVPQRIKEMMQSRITKAKSIRDSQERMPF